VGQPFLGLDRFFHRIGVFDGEFRPGRWLYCGYFLELEHVMRTDGILATDFLPAD